jgi:hypothetical protein
MNYVPGNVGLGAGPKNGAFINLSVECLLYLFLTRPQAAVLANYIAERLHIS